MRQGDGFRITIRDVAATARVSITTVSHTISSSRSVTPETAEKVWKAVRKLGYLPNQSAQGLRRGRCNAIGIIIPDMGNIFYTQLATTIHRFALSRDYQLLIRNTQDLQEEEETAVRQLLARSLVDGIIVVPTSGKHEYIEEFITRGARIVVLNRRLTDTKAPVVRGNNEEAAYHLATHLIQLGHRRIAAILSREGISTGDERLAGFQRAMRDHNVENDLVVWRQDGKSGCSQRCDGYEATSRLMGAKDPPTAILAGSFQFAEGVMMSLRDLSIACPESVAVAAFGSAWPAQVMTPRLTVMQQDFETMGVAATKLLISWIETGTVAHQDLRVGCQFFVGDSCGWKARKEANNVAADEVRLPANSRRRGCSATLGYCPYESFCQEHLTYHQQDRQNAERMS